jgi:hypothetical protein
MITHSIAYKRWREAMTHRIRNLPQGDGADQVHWEVCLRCIESHEREFEEYSSTLTIAMRKLLEEMRIRVQVCPKWINPFHLPTAETLRGYMREFTTKSCELCDGCEYELEHKVLSQ